MRMILANCTIWDGLRHDPLEEAVIEIKDGRITSVRTKPGTAATPNDDAVFLDLSGRFVVPGLWDSHCHLALGIPMTDHSQRPPLEAPAQRCVRAGRRAIDALHAGVTSLRVVGEADGVDIAWKKAFDAGQWVGPRLFVCGRALAATGGHGTEAGIAIELNGPDAFRRGVREQLKAGADQVKLMVTGGVAGSERETPEDVQLSVDEIRSAVAAAHEMGVIVGAHIANPAGAKVAVREGVDVVEHGYVLDQEAVSLMSRNRVHFVPTLFVTQRPSEEYQAIGLPEYALKNIGRKRAQHRKSVQMAIESGVKIAIGTDATPPGLSVVSEMELLVSLGMSPHDALTAATLSPAILCRVNESLGTIEEGKLADLVAVDGDLVADISALKSVVLVLKEGNIAVNRLS